MGTVWCLHAANPLPFNVQAVRIPTAVILDGDLKEAAWNKALVIDTFIQREPHEGRPASERTAVRVVYDDDTLFIGVMCFDENPELIVANEMRRDAELKDNDYFEIVLDTFLSRRNGFYFAINPLGARRDALIRDDGSNINWDWDGIWDAEVQRTPQGWSAEIAIPFATLRFTREEEQTWGINFGRHIARKREEVYWAPILRDYGREGQYKVSYFGRMTGLRDLKPAHRFQLMPYLIGGGEKLERSESFRATGDAGLDLKARLTSNLTADVTWNTDFAQVEADQEKFNLTRFSLFFPEKRGFFLEGADIFRMGERFRRRETPTLLFFSRTIGISDDGMEVPIVGGARITGKAGPYDLGVMDLVTDRISYTEDDEQVKIEKSNYAVMRLKRDLFRKSTIGVMVLSKNSIDSSFANRAGGIDFNLAFGDNFQSGGYIAKTATTGLEDRDWSGYLDAIWENDHFQVDLSYLDVGENFNSEMGFINRTDIRKIRSNISLRPRPGILNIRKSYLYNKMIYVENHVGQVESRMVQFGNHNNFQDGSNFTLSYLRNYEFLSDPFEIKTGVFIPTGGHEFNNFSSSYESDKSRKFSFRGEIKTGKFYNGSLFQSNGSGFLKFSRRFNLEFILSRNRFDLDVSDGRFTVVIAATRIIYAFSPDLFAKAYVQWNDDERMFKSNFLVRWIYKPGANLFFIYNETREIGSQGFLQDRVVMLKVSFLFNG